jgi:PAS domain S-box-containing protein
VRLEWPVNLQAGQDVSAAGPASVDTAERLELALAAGDLGDWSWDAATDLLKLGPRAAALVGLAAAGPIPWSRLGEVLHPDDRVQARMGIDAALASRTDYRVEVRLLRRRGVARWIAATGRAVYDRAGRVTGMIGVIQDVTERRQQEEALREETRVLELLNETGARLGSQLDLNALLQVVTDAATQISGARAGAFFLRTGGEDDPAFTPATLAGADREAFAAARPVPMTPLFAPTWRGERPVRIDDVAADARFGQVMPHDHSPSGAARVRSYLAVPVTSRSGDVIGGLFLGHPEPGRFSARSERLVLGVAAQAAVAIDNARLYERAQQLATERQQLLDRERVARATAERMCALQDDFLAIVSHELRGPLTAIQGWVHMLQRRSTKDDLERGLEVIEQSVTVQRKLIEDLLDVRRIAAGQLRLNLQPLQPISFIQPALETVRLSAQEKSVAIRELLDPAVPPVSGDATRLQQVLVNLLSNAVKFTPAGGSIELALRAASDCAEISVADNGVGIPADFLPHVFDRFRQGDGSAGEREGGLGLGLAIVKHLVDLHGGQVSAASAGEGRGATFTLRLPLAAADAAQL